MGKMVRAVLFAVMAVFSTAVFAEDEDPCAMPGSLTEIDGVYQIGTCGDLYKFAEMVNGGETGINGRLTADIVVNVGVLSSDGTLNGDGSNFTQWTPIGTYEIPYAGVFDGDGHTISGLYFNDENVNYVGLFGFIISDKAKVQNVGVVDSYIRGAGTVGGVVGLNAGGTISNVYNTGAVSGTGSRVGGVVGDNGGTVSNVYNTGAVSGLGEVGGVVGLNAVGAVSNVYNTGAVSGDGWVGGVVGDNGGTVSNVYYNTDMRCEHCGSPIEGTTGKTTAELAALDVALAFENSDGVWVAGYDSISNGWRKYAFPSLKGVGTAPTFIELDPNATEVEISNVEELLKFAELVNAGNTTINGKLTADIVVNENLLGTDNANVKDDGTFDEEAYKSAHANAEPKVWTPIGTSSTPYTGTFDGKDAEGNVHVISGLYFNDENVNYVGLFGYIGDDAKVQNVGVVDSYILGKNVVGGVVGHNAGGFIRNVYNTGAVSGDVHIGGVVGENAGDVRMVYNTGAVSGEYWVGGVVGNNGGTVSNVYNTGAVSGYMFVGGVVGNNGGTVSNVYNTGAVSGTGTVGGVVGFVHYHSTVENAYYNTDSYTGSAVGECVEEREYENVEGKTTAELASTTLPAGFSSEIWNAGSGEPVVRNGKLLLELPGLKDVGTQPEIEYTGFQPNAGGFYEISNAVELKCFAQLVNSGTTSINGRLTADICLNACGEGESVLKADGTLNGDGSNFTQWTPIGTKEKPYKGTFDGKDAEGNAHVISGLYFNDGNVDYVGLFGYIGNGANVQNVGVVDSYIRGAGTVGGVAGYNTIGSTVSNVYNTGSVSGADNVGGVVGNNYGTVSNVYNTGSVNGTGGYVGGVVGYNYNGTVSSVYNTGSVSGADNVGGVVGHKYGGPICGAYNTGTVKGVNNVGGVVGYIEGTSLDVNLYYNTDFYAGSAVGKGGSESVYRAEGKTTAELAALNDADLRGLFADSEWIGGDSIFSKGWIEYTLPSLNGVGTAPTVSVVDPKATEVEISNADELFKFAMFMNAGNTTVNGKLTADICVNACGEGVLNADGTLNGNGSNFTQWTPIGTELKPYKGTFDGDGHTISGLYFNDENAYCVGLFGYIGSGSKVQNVGVVDSYIRGKKFVGVVVAYNGGTVSNVYNTGVVSGNSEVGGVVGYNGGTVSNVYNTGAVSGNSEVGGVVGRDWRGIVSNVYNTGSVIGQDYVGGLVGENGGSVSNGYNNTDFYAGSAIGENVLGTNKNVEGKNSAELVAGTSLELDTAVWVLGGVGVGTTNDSLYYPYLKVFGPHKYVLGDVKKYAITVAVNDKTMGTVTGAGTYEYGTDVEIKAVANEGYKFTDWEDDVNTAVRTITVTKAETYTANFEAIPSSSSEVESSSSVAESSSSVDESSSSEAVSSSSETKFSSSEAKSSSSDAKSSSSEAKSSSSSAKSSSSSAKSSSSEAKSSSSEAKSSSSEAKSSSSSAKSSSSSVKSSSSEAKSSSSEAKSSSSEAKSSSSQKESIIAQAQLPQFSVTASGKMVSIAGARPNSIVNVFDMQGNMVKTVVATAANFTFALPSAGVYIVKNGYTAKRVNVR